MELWYKEGLQFDCRQCGRCCGGAPGYVWVTDEEIAEIAKLLDFQRFQFEMKFVRTVGKRKSLHELSNFDCILFDPEKKGCRAYEARPAQCRTWPFWSRNIDRPNSWKKTAKFCPGCNKGPLHSLEEIEDRRKIIEI